MNFINPRIDFAFKKIFGDEKHKEILISFLNAILYEGQTIIQDLQILDPYSAPKVSGLKDTFLDVKARLMDGTQVIIEMQVLAVAAFGKRVLYNVAKTYSAQLKQRENYRILKPVIGLTITDFEMFSCDEVADVLSRFTLYDQQNGYEYPIKDIELVFVELPKFTKDLDELETLTDKWLYFMRYASELEEIPVTMKSEPAIEQAFTVANYINLRPEEYDELLERSLFVNSMNATVEEVEEKAQQAEEKAQQAEEKAQQAEEKAQQAEEKAQQAEEEAQQAKEEAQQAKEEAQQAKEEAQQAKEDGKRQGVEEVAYNLLDVLDDETISQKTGLSLAEVQKLRSTR